MRRSRKWQVDYKKAGFKTCKEQGLPECKSCLDSQKPQAERTRKSVCEELKRRRHELFRYCVPEDNDELGLCKCKFGGIDKDVAKSPDVPEMVQCSNDKCQENENKGWFHLTCVGLKTLPGENEDWYCPYHQRQREEDEEPPQEARKRNRDAADTPGRRKTARRLPVKAPPAPAPAPPEAAAQPRPAPPAVPPPQSVAQPQPAPTGDPAPATTRGGPPFKCSCCLQRSRQVAKGRGGYCNNKDCKLFSEGPTRQIVNSGDDDDDDPPRLGETGGGNNEAAPAPAPAAAPAPAPAAAQLVPLQLSSEALSPESLVEQTHSWFRDCIQTQKGLRFEQFVTWYMDNIYNGGGHYQTVTCTGRPGDGGRDIQCMPFPRTRQGAKCEVINCKNYKDAQNKDLLDTMRSKLETSRKTTKPYYKAIAAIHPRFAKPHGQDGQGIAGVLQGLNSDLHEEGQFLDALEWDNGTDDCMKAMLTAALQDDFMMRIQFHDRLLDNFALDGEDHPKKWDHADYLKRVRAVP